LRNFDLVSGGDSISLSCDPTTLFQNDANALLALTA
jgi:hypothetical protein